MGFLESLVHSQGVPIIVKMDAICVSRQTAANNLTQDFLIHAVVYELNALNNLEFRKIITMGI